MIIFITVEGQVPSQVPPKVPYIKIGEGVSHPCGTECFLQPPRNSTSLCHATIWTTQDVDFLFSLLNYTPDISPCDLAIICRKPCREVSSFLIFNGCRDSNNSFRLTANVHIIGPPLNSQRKESLLLLLPHQEFMVSRFIYSLPIGFDWFMIIEESAKVFTP